MKKPLSTILLILMILILLQPIAVLATEVEATKDFINSGEMAPNHNQLSNYVWDEAGLLDMPEVFFPNLLMRGLLFSLGITFSFLELSLNPTPVFLSDSDWSFITVMSWLFSLAKVFKSIFLTLLPIVLAVMVAIDFTKGDYRRILNRFVQVAFGLLLLFIYDDFVNNPEDMRSLVNFSQSGQYLILGATNGSMDESNLSIKEETLNEVNTTVNSDFKNITDDLYQIMLFLPWEYGEYQKTNMKLGKTRQLTFDPTEMKKVLKPEVNKTSDVQNIIDNKSYDTPYLVRGSDGNVVGDGKVTDDTLWRDVITFYPKGSDARKALIKELDPKAYPEGFSAGNRIGTAFWLWTSLTPIMLFWFLVAIGLFMSYFLFLFGVPFGAFAFVFLMLPVPQTIRLLKGWLGFMSGTLIAKYLTVFFAGMALAISKMVLNMLLGGSGITLDTPDVFTPKFLLLYSLIYVLFSYLLWKFRAKISPFRYLGFAMESAYSGMRGYKSRMYDPLYQLERKLRKGVDDFEEGTNKRLGKAGTFLFKKKDKTNPEDNGNTNTSNAPVNSNRLLSPFKKVNSEKSTVPNKEGSETKNELAKDTLTGEIIDKKGNTEANQEKIEAPKTKLLEVGKDKLASITYKNTPLSKVLKNRKDLPQVKRESTIAKGKYNVETHDLPDGGRLVRLTPKGKVPIKQTNQEKPKALALPSTLLKNQKVIPKLNKSANGDGKTTPVLGGGFLNSTIPKLNKVPVKSIDNNNPQLPSEKLKNKNPKLVRHLGNTARVVGKAIKSDQGIIQQYMPKDKVIKGIQQGFSGDMVGLVKTATSASVVATRELAKENMPESKIAQRGLPSNQLTEKGFKLTQSLVTGFISKPPSTDLNLANVTSKRLSHSPLKIAKPIKNQSQSSDIKNLIPTNVLSDKGVANMIEQPKNIDFLASGKWGNLANSIIPSGGGGNQKPNLSLGAIEDSSSGSRIRMNVKPSLQKHKVNSINTGISVIASPKEQVTENRIGATQKMTVSKIPSLHDSIAKTETSSLTSPDIRKNQQENVNPIPSTMPVISKPESLHEKVIPMYNIEPSPKGLISDKKMVNESIPMIETSGISEPIRALVQEDLSIQRMEPTSYQSVREPKIDSTHNVPLSFEYVQPIEQIEQYQPTSIEMDNLEPLATSLTNHSDKSLPSVELFESKDTKQEINHDYTDVDIIPLSQESNMDKPEVLEVPIVNSEIPIVNNEAMVPSTEDIPSNILSLDREIQELGKKILDTKTTAQRKKDMMDSIVVDIEDYLENPFDQTYINDNRLSNEQRIMIEDFQHQLQDDIFSKAVEVALTSGKASQNLLRKEMNVDIHVARELIKRMEQEKIIGKREGVKGHPVLYEGKSLEDIRKQQKTFTKKEINPNLPPKLHDNKLSIQKEAPKLKRPPKLMRPQDINPTRLHQE